MGSAPPHIALISGLEATGLAGEEIAARLRRVASAHAPVSGRVLAKCKVTQNGCVLVGVECPGSLAIARALSSALPGADTYYASQHPEQQLITLGRFAGVDAVGFAEWLSESLAGQRALLPEFTCVSVQLSDEAHPFPNPQIPLTGTASTAVSGGALDSGLGLGLNLGVGLGLGGGFGGFDSGYGGVGMGGVAAPDGSGNYAAPATAAAHNAAAAFGTNPTPVQPVQPPMPSTPPPQRMMAPAPSGPPSYASAIGLKAAAAETPTRAGPTSPAPRPSVVMPAPPATPPGGSFAQRAAAGMSTPPRATPASPAAAMSYVQTPEQLLAAFQQLTARAEGAGVLGKDANGAFAVRPRDSASWSQRLQPLVNVMQSTLSSVGAARFLAMLDRVANPHGTSIAAELGARLGGAATLDIVQDMQLMAEVASTPVVSANEGTPVRLVTAPVNQAIVGVAGHCSTASCVIVGTAAERGADPMTGKIRIVPISLNLEPIANVTPPAHTPYLGLTFAWLVIGSAQGAAPAAQSSFVDGSTSYAPSPNSSAGVRRPGDWTCVSCYAHNFASRDACFRCRVGRADAGARADASSDASGYSQGGAKAGSEQGGPSAGSFRPGDWICDGCRAHNFASRSACFRCRAPSAGGDAAAGGGSPGSNPDNFRSGDWICKDCKAHNFASRSSCFKCTRGSGA